MANQKIYKDYGEKNGRIFLGQQRKFVDFPDFLGAQKNGFNDFINHYLEKLFEENMPIEDNSSEKLELKVENIEVGESKYSPRVCKRKELTYGGVVKADVNLMDKENNKQLFKKQINIGVMPLMTKGGSYIINGVERVIINQIVRSYGIFFNGESRKSEYSFKVIPNDGSWLQVFIDKRGKVSVRVNRSRKFPVTALLRVFGYETDESIRQTFKGIFGDDDFNYLDYTLEKDSTTNAGDAAVQIYNKIRPGEMIDEDSAMDYVKNLFLNIDRFNLGRIARRKINAKLDLDKPIDKDSSMLFDAVDLVAALKYMFHLANGKRNYYVDDIDHLSNRRIRTMGENLYSYLQSVMRRFVKNVKGKLSILDLDSDIKLSSLVNFKIIDNSIQSFFATSQLSQFMDQMNPLAELEHKRRITALGPGGIKRETATFEVRDVHPSHYGRICPIETPEGQNIGLVIHQTTYSKVNEDGFVETPGVKVKRKVRTILKELEGRITDFDIKDEDGNVVLKDGEKITKKKARKIKDIYGGTEEIKVRPFLSEEIEYISPENDEKAIIADGTIDLDEDKNIMKKRVPGRHFQDMEVFHVDDVTHMDVDPSQIFSISTSLIPFVHHDDAVRAEMGTNMQKQAVPLVKPQAPKIGTGIESEVAGMTYALIKAEGKGEVIYVDGNTVKVKYDDLGTKKYELITFRRSNQKSLIHQVPKVELGQKVDKGDVLAEGPSVDEGEIAIGKDLRVAFMAWEGYNFEDAVVISDKLVKDDDLTSIHIIEKEIEVANTKLGPEVTTNDIPGVSLSKLDDLGEDGIVRQGAYVSGGDILVGKITPKKKGEASPEEKLIQAIFGDKSKQYKNTSMYCPSGVEGKIIDVVVLDDQHAIGSVSAGIIKKVKVYIASTRKIEVGDKLAGRHGNKGVIATVVPEEDMPFTKDGKPIEIILNPLGVISRMNIGQVLEVQLSMIADLLDEKYAVPLFSDFDINKLQNILENVGLPKDGKFELYDGRTGEKYEDRVTVGFMHILKLEHMVEDKIHARSVGPYSLITQQPLGGKARKGGQRFGEMEVWALEAYSAVNTLQEMLTIKSDDVRGRNQTYQAIVKGAKTTVSGLPESFNYLLFILRGLNQSIQPLDKDEMEKIHEERMEKVINLGLKSADLSGLDDQEDKQEVKLSKKEKEEIIDEVLDEMSGMDD